ncbi:conserved membrane protein of unknown function [Microbacterium sp. Nx66]|uniref:DUF998 domain-containing protein n=1 Tax=Microbacterium sp. Nx66 TaxID=2766784 RepID=UPI00186034FC|nr:DUF998 domain-containing protein [Microbacterium sp. Nx66]CAD5137762.1 conserved membrane protein of unknown function [Microbacterium sp. Nx66]
MDTRERLRGEGRAVLATVVCFVGGALAGALLLAGPPRPLTGEGGLALPAAGVAGSVAALAFVVSTLLHRRDEPAAMPRWQRVVSRLSAAALTVAFGAVTAMGVLLTAEVLAAGLRGLALGAIGGGLLTGVAAAVGGRLAFGAGIGLRTADLAGLLFGFLVIGTLFAMVTAVDPRWWEENFSQLGVGWAFNGTLVVAGLLVATVGSYIGRDLHRLLGDHALSRIATVVVLWAAAGLALAAVGLLPLYRAPVPHDIAAVAALLLFLGAAAATTLIVPGRPLALVVTSVAVGVLVVGAVLLWWPLRFFPVTAVEAVVVGLGLLWMTTLVRVLAIVVPEGTRPSARRSLWEGRRSRGLRRVGGPGA